MAAMGLLAVVAKPEPVLDKLLLRPWYHCLYWFDYGSMIGGIPARSALCYKDTVSTGLLEGVGCLILIWLVWLSIPTCWPRDGIAFD